MIGWLAGAAWAGRVLLVETPGTEPAAWRPLRDALAADGHTVAVVAFPCSGTAADFRAAVARAAPTAPYAVVAHGVGAPLALDLPAAGWVLLGPTLAPAHSQALDAATAAAAQADGPVVLRPTALAAVLGVADAPLRCVSADFAREVARWQSDGVALATPTGPVTVLAAPRDEVAPVEALVPAARALGARLVRLGLGHFDPTDPDHAGLLTAPSALAETRRAVRRALEPGSVSGR